MSVDSLLREQGQRLRDEVRVALDVEEGWTELLAARRRRRRVAGLSVASAVAATVVGVAALVGTGPGAVDREVPPADTPSLTPTRPSAEQGCLELGPVECLGDGVVRVRGEVTYLFVVPSDFEPRLEVEVKSQSVVAYQKRTQAGVTILSGVRPADPRAGVLDARGLARWIADQAFVESGAVRRDLLDGRPAWSVGFATEKSPWDEGWPDMGDVCNEQQSLCRPLLRSPDGSESGAWADMSGRYWLVDTDAGVVALWSWAFEDVEDALSRNERLVRSFVVESGQ